ncbi:MAG: UDP-N-acetylmuramoyl-tripeptide--D-alanyl-D-alanine ligase [Alicyclobacillus sp.]|nr:UDP-N-acetylmuramoyl-tripeptide--D-alanyl-D-alanine ligase [Alicyclobacillus sp.]
MISSILRTRWPVFSTPGNLNFFNHTAQYVKQIHKGHRAAVLEYGLSGPGHIRRHCLILQPSIGVITNVGTAHIGHFGGDVRRLAFAKSELIRYMKPTGIAFVNRDDQNTKHLRFGRFRGRIFTVGITREADYRATKIRFVRGGMVFRVKLHGQEHTFFIPIYGRHHVYNALFAIGVADQLGFRPAQMKLGLRRYKRLGRRLTFYQLGRGVQLIDDSFSANPNAVKAAIDVLQAVGTGTKAAVLGSMLEMGKLTVSGHRGVGRYAATHGVQYLFTYGQAARHIGAGATAAGMPKARIRHFTRQAALHRFLAAWLRPNQTLLVKGSHAMGMWRTADFLRRTTKPWRVPMRRTDRRTKAH